MKFVRFISLDQVGAFYFDSSKVPGRLKSNQPEGREARIRVAVSGMSCEGCAKSIERALRKVEGVKSVSVSLTEARAEVIFDKTQLSPQVVVEKIRDVGFDASLPPSLSATREP